MATRLQISQKERLNIIQQRIYQYDIRFPNAELSDKLDVDAGNISNMLNGKKPISDNFFTSFITAYPEKNTNENNLLPNNATVTLADYIRLQDERIQELKKDKEWLQDIVNSSLLKISTDQQYVLAYQKAFVDYEADQVSKGDQKLKEEIKYKMNTLVDGIIQNDASMDNDGGSGK